MDRPETNRQGGKFTTRRNVCHGIAQAVRAEEHVGQDAAEDWRDAMTILLALVALTLTFTALVALVGPQ
jgi:hypothetical protein